MDIEWLVGDKYDHDVSFGAGAVFHIYPFGEPNKRAGSVSACVCHQRAFQHVHAVRAVVMMERIDHTGRIPYQPDFHSRVRIFNQVLAI